MSGAETSEASDGQGGISNQLATLVPSFDPSKDELLEYQQKVELLLMAWPQNKIRELVTRLVLNCKGSAFQKLQIHQQELLTGETKTVHRLIELLGGHWGKIGLERKFEDAERALFQTCQKSDEANDSYLARADILWSRLLSRKMKIEELQAYILLRGSLLSPEEKKKVIIDSDNSLEGELTIKRVSDSIRMLGAGFFHEVTGQKRAQRVKIYDQSTLVAQDIHDGDETLAAQGTSEFPEEIYTEEDFVDQMAQEEDQDAIFIADFENTATEILQSDPELSGAFSAYTEARKRLSDKFKNRGFWPTSSSSWKSSGGKGKSKTKGKFGKYRKTLQERILSSYCKACNRKGHWKAECPYRNAGGGQAVPSQMAAPASAVTTQESGGLPLEFFQVPQQQMPTLDASRPLCEFSFGTVSFVNSPGLEIAKRCLHESFCKIMNEKGNMKGSHLAEIRNEKPMNLPPDQLAERNRESQFDQPLSNAVKPHRISEDSHVRDQSEDWMLFATHGTFGVVDSGATKTVIGSSFVAELLQGLVPEVRKHVSRCSCNITFRFGNHGTLTSKHALIVPVGSLQLKIAIVEGNTPFLISNTLLRALKAKVDCEFDRIVSSQLQKPIPLTLTSRGLYLADLNDLVLFAKRNDLTISTFVTDSSKDENPIDADELMDQSEQQNNVVHEPETEPSKMQPPGLCVETVQSDCEVKLKDSPASDCLASEVNQTGLSILKPLTEIEKPERPSSNRENVQPPERSCCPSSTGTSSGSDHSASAPSRDPRDGHGRFLGSPSAIREHTQGQALRDGVARGSMGDVVHESLQKQLEVRASALPEVCGTDGREIRSDQWPSIRRSTKTESIESTPRDASCQEPVNAEDGHCQGQGKSSGAKTSDHRSWTFGGRLQHARDRGHGSSRRDVSLSDYDGRSANASSRAGVPCCDHAEQDAEHGNGTAAGDRALATECKLSRESGKPCTLDPVQQALIAGEIDPPSEDLKPNLEQNHLRRLIVQVTQEFEHIKKCQKLQTSPIDLLEVFCDRQSQLTQQVLNLGGKAIRHGLNEGDLMTKEGRSRLFHEVHPKASTPLVLSSLRTVVSLGRVQCKSIFANV